MRVHQLEEDIMTNHIIEQLHQLGKHDTDGKSLRELKNQLAVARDTKADVNHPSNKYF